MFAVYPQLPDITKTLVLEETRVLADVYCGRAVRRHWPVERLVPGGGPPCRHRSPHPPGTGGKPWPSPDWAGRAGPAKMLAGLAPMWASTSLRSVAGCWGQVAPSQSSFTPWPCFVYDVLAAVLTDCTCPLRPV
ncbi:UNVERIFIED_ORG: hypothetical protein J2X79_003749 [Arthrobacter globiformis]|nr:hypothetical protein [Arthrobacter globiformis]